MSRLTASDVPIFTALVEREFPQGLPTDPAHAQLHALMVKAAEAEGKQVRCNSGLRLPKNQHDISPVSC